MPAGPCAAAMAPCAMQPATRAGSGFKVSRPGDRLKKRFYCCDKEVICPLQQKKNKPFAISSMLSIEPPVFMAGAVKSTTVSHRSLEPCCVLLCAVPTRWRGYHRHQPVRQSSPGSPALLAAPLPIACVTLNCQKPVPKPLSGDGTRPCVSHHPTASQPEPLRHAFADRPCFPSCGGLRHGHPGTETHSMAIGITMHEMCPGPV